MLPQLTLPLLNKCRWAALSMVYRKGLIERRYAIAMTVVAMLEVYGICTAGSGAEKRRGAVPTAKIIIQSFPTE